MTRKFCDNCGEVLESNKADTGRISIVTTEGRKKFSVESSIRLQMNRPGTDVDLCRACAYEIFALAIRDILDANKAENS